jgi:hypothetical protein
MKQGVLENFKELSDDDEGRADFAKNLRTLSLLLRFFD